MKSNYSTLDKILHQTTLNNPLFIDLSFELEKSLFLSSSKPILPKILFINGLARSGTTALLNHLINSKAGFSLTYLDLPFLFLPNSLKKFKKNKKISPKTERAHGDQIKINEESPEAIDEIFWKFRLQNRYIHQNTLSVHEISKEDLNEYLQFIKLHLYANDSKVYITKNNNSLLRINSLIKNPSFQANYIFLLRDPLSHANSLLRQHLQFKKLHKEDPFSLTYFNTLGHHEFGGNVKSFDFNQPFLNQMLAEYDPQSINFWLATWLNYYQYLDSIYTNQFTLISFDDLCKKPEIVLSKLCDKMDLNQEPLSIDSFVPPNYSNIEGISTELLESCNQLYINLRSVCISAK